MLDHKDIEKRVDTIVSKEETLRGKIQEVLIQLAGHAYQHGDSNKTFTQADRLADLKGVNREALFKWMKEYAFLTFDEGGSVKLNKSARKKADFADGDALIAHLTENAERWWEMGKSKSDTLKAIDVASKVEAIAKQVKEAKENNREVKADRASLEESIRHLTDAVAAIDAA